MKNKTRENGAFGFSTPKHHDNSQFIFRSMHLYILYLSVVLLNHSRFFVNADIMADLSDECRSNRNLSFFLTSGNGRHDSFVGMIAQVEDIRCKIMFLVSKGTSIIFVFEFPDWIKLYEPCGKVRNSIIVSKASDNDSQVKINVCKRLKEISSNVIRFVSNGNVNITVKADDQLDTLKITATSVRDAGEGACIPHEETNCVFNEHLYCMSSELVCDNNINCGVRWAYDESTISCAAINPITPGIIITGIQIVFLTFILLVSMLRKWLPNKKGTFIYKKDETLTDKDRSKSQKYFTVKMRILTDAVGGPNINTINLPPLAEMGQSTILRPKITLRKYKMGRMVKNYD